jgi:hypothetical protein
MASTPRSVVGERLVLVTLVGGLVGYAVLALLAHRFVSGIAAPIVAVLLAIRHPRARFSAYIFFSAIGVRGLIAGSWPVVAFAAAGILALQLPAARRAWPRLRAGATRSDGGASFDTRERLL